MIELILDGPGRNALSTVHMSRLLGQIAAAGGQPLLVTGAGNTFSAGLDLRELATLDNDMTAEKAEETRVLAANQGLYNGFLAAGLIWSFFAADPRPIRLFFLGCVVVAGVFDGLTAMRKILYLQAGPALVALVASIVL